MGITKSEISAKFTEVKGKKLISVCGSVHEHQGQLNLKNPITVRMNFGGPLQICLTGSSNGETLNLVDSLEPEADMNEHGKIKTTELNAVEPWPLAMQQELTQASVIETKDSVSLGLEFVFENQHTVCVLNIGDEIFTYQNVPPAIIAEEGITTDRIF